MVNVLIAAATIDPWTVIAPAHFTSVQIPATQAGDSLLRDTAANRAALTRISANRPIPMGTPFVDSDLISAPKPVLPSAPPGAASMLRDGMRAIALPVTAETAVAGLIATGDRVDVLVSYNRSDSVRAVRTILRNVRVLATDRDTAAGTGQPAATAPKTVTLELHPEGAKVLALYRHAGDLILVLSPPDGGDMPEIVDDAPLLSTDISGMEPARGATGSTVQVIRGTARAASPPSAGVQALQLLQGQINPGGVPASP